MASSRITPASLPEPLRTLFTRQRRSWQVTLFGGAAALFAIGAALIWFEASPPLSTEERQLIGVGALVMSSSLAAIVWALKGTEPAFHAFTNADVVWIHHALQRGGRQFIRFGTTLGNVERLRLDVDGVHLHDAEARSAIDAMARAHPLAVIGYSTELERAFRANPVGFKRSGPIKSPTLADRVIARRGPLVLGTFVGAVLLVFAAVPVLAGLMKGPPIPKPTFETIALDKAGLRLIVRTVPGATVELITGQTRTANQAGVASFDVPLSEVRMPADTRQMVVTASQQGQYAAAIVQFPRTLGEARSVPR